MIRSKLAFGIVSLLPCLSLGAQALSSTRLPPVPSVQIVSGVGDADQLLATWMIAGCNNEVALARIAVRKAHDAGVKRFAQQMVDDHASLATKLKPFAGGDAKTADAGHMPGKDVKDAKNVRDAKDAKDAKNVKAEGATVEASGVRPPAAKGEFDHAALIRDLSKRCLDSQTKMLEAKSGADFDQSFLRGQVVMHDQAVIMAEVFGDYASKDLRPTLEQAAKTLHKHLEQAMTLCKKGEAVAETGKPIDHQQN